MSKEAIDYFGGDELAGSVFLNKYALEGETTPIDLHKRMAVHLAEVAAKKDDNIELLTPLVYNNLSDYGRHRDGLSENRLFEYFDGFKYIIPQGSNMSGIGNPKIQSLSNCFVIGQAHDSYGGVMMIDQEQVQLMKRRGGVGHDLSKLRPKGTPTNNSAKTSTGAVSFAPRFSHSTREVAQDGRRGALMLSMIIRHPDSPEFNAVKADKTSITGANISSLLTNDFMEAVAGEQDFILRFPVDANISDIPQEEINEAEYNILLTVPHGRYIKKVKAKEVYDQLVYHAWKSAEPGQLFLDNYWNYSPDGVYELFRMVTTNPCGEIGLQAYDACRLVATNFLSFVDNPYKENATLNEELAYEVFYEAQRVNDLIVTLELEHIDRIIDKITNDPEPEEVKRVELNLWNKVKEQCTLTRRTGTGFTALADMLAALGLRYGSPESIAMTDKVMKIKMKAELNCTIDLAVIHGPCPAWDNEKEFTLKNQVVNPNQASMWTGNNKFFQMLLDEFPKEALRMMKYGRRNLSWSTVAPTGTVSIMTQTSGGIEPVFLAYYFRKKKVNPDDKDTRVDFVDESGDSWQEYPVLHEQFRQWLLVTDTEAYGAFGGEADWLEKKFKESPWNGSLANDLDWIERLDMQLAVQKYTTHSISCTINLPKDVSQERVGQIYMRAWQLGLKGVTVYRDGSRDGVLTSTSVKDLAEEFPQYDSPKRPVELEADYYMVRSGARKYAVIIGLLDSKPYEVFAFENPESDEDLKGKIIKVRSGVYKFESPEYTINNLQLSSEHTDEKLFTKLISQLLRGGAKPVFVVDVIDGVDLQINAFSRVVARTLKKYIKNGEESTLKCLECSSKEVVFQEGCQTCMNCGSSKCG